ncbi:hypothetical protein WJX84_008262 [Apatococcus fuscideae]|uniref:adenine phosphoribosyltransferase n=1 Tax=Apatococcus fuscideae TaxID=2026836 RepID=A0AAW1TAW6_9CHLO
MVFQAKPLDDKLQYVSDSIRMVPDFPKKGILFQDITTLTRDPKALKLCVEAFVERYRGQKIDVVAGIEARGFIFGPPLAMALGVGFVPLRKPGKLPGETIGAEYQLEYGSDRIEMTVESITKGQNVVIIDDLIATGGTLGAAVQLVEKVGAKVHEAACVVELPELQGRAKLKATNVPLFVLLEKAA